MLTLGDAPALFPALAAAAIFAATSARFERSRRENALRYSSLDFFIQAAKPRRWPHLALTVARVAGVILVVLSVSRPQYSTTYARADASVIFCIDTSGSMALDDVWPTRAAVARRAVSDAIEQLAPGVRVGMVTFSSRASILLPPTLDRSRLRGSLSTLPSPNGRTVIGDALQLALQLPSPDARRTVVLITDGGNTSGSDPLEAARMLRADRMTFVAFGIGTQRAPLPLDVAALREIAATAGGRAIAGGDSDALAHALLEGTRRVSAHRVTHDVSLEFALSGVVLLAAAALARTWTTSI